MDCTKVGALILSLRKEKNMTQKDVAERMNISDKTISKWERGMGCPDVSLLSELSGILGVNIEKILLGDLEEKDKDEGNMKRFKFYVCKNCGNVINSTGDAEVSCCGRRLSPLVAKPADEAHIINVSDSDDEFYITMDHPMGKSHYISFAAFVGFDKMLFIKFYPEQSLEMRIPKMQRGKLYVYCSEHGLWVRGV